MNQYGDWTDDQINREVAGRFGYTCEEEDGFWPNREMVWRDMRGMKASEPRYPTDMNDAIALLDDLQDTYEHGKVSLLRSSKKDYWMCWLEFNGHHDTIIDTSRNPARAICEAWLAWKDRDSDESK
jgi:hypothetical protein